MTGSVSDNHIVLNNNDLSLLLLNIQSLRNKSDELHLFINQCECPNIVLITEHWLKEGELFFMPGYSAISSFCRNMFGHGGCMILVNTKFLTVNCFKPIVKFNDLLEEKIFEFSIAYSKAINVYVICVYRSPNAEINSFFNRMEALLSSIPVSSSVILAGDLNINFYDSDKTATIRLTNLFRSFNLQMHVKCPTRVAKFTSTLIDYVCSNICSEMFTCSVINAALSDHNAVLCKVHMIPLKKTARYKQGRIFSSSNYGKFYRLCDSASWRSVLSSLDPIGEFHNKLMQNFHATFPVRKIKLTNKKPWFTRGLVVSSRNLRNLHYIRKFTDNPHFHNYFNNYRSIYRKLIKLAKHFHYSNRLANASNKQRESWSIINDIRKKSQFSPNINDIDMSPDSVNKFYCSIAENLTKNIIQRTDPLTFLSNNAGVKNSFYFFPTTLEELKQIISGVKNKKSSGDDGLSIKLFASLPDKILDILVQAINLSWESGVFSLCLKLAKVIPFHKSGDLEDPSNYRPISLLSNLSKIIEKLVKSRMISFLNTNNVLSSVQFGFREHCNTDDAIFQFLEGLYSGINGGGVTAAAFCDLSKAFDCVNHHILLQKLFHYGFRGVTLTWFQSYLSDRHQKVYIGSSQSMVLENNWGVPQGSVLGPLLFLIFINDLASLPITGKFTLFADDTTILWHCADHQSLKRAILTDLQQLKSWCDSNLLVLNLSKTNILSFRFDLGLANVHNVLIECRPETKFLGVIIDSELSFGSHVVSLSRRVSSGCFAVRITAIELGTSLSRSVYFALIESRLRYGICFWGFCSQSLFNSVFILQKRALRYICGANNRDHCRPLFKREKILTLYSLFILETVTLVYKNRHRFMSHNATYSTRNASNLMLPIPHSTLVKRSVVYESIKIYNHLPRNLTSSPSLRYFRREVKRLLVGAAYYSLSEFYCDNF